MPDSEISNVDGRDGELQMLARLVHNSPGMAYRCLHDADWTLEFVSAGCEPLLGYSQADLSMKKHVVRPTGALAAL